MSKRGVKKRPWLPSVVVIVVFCAFCSCAQVSEGTCEPRDGCTTALASYKAQSGETLDNLSARFQTSTEDVKFYNILNGSNVTGQNLLFPFPCECVNNQLQHNFIYEVQAGDTVSTIASTVFGNLSHVDWILQANGKAETDVIYPGEKLQVPVQCFCGDPTVSPKFGLFTTYITVSTDNSTSLEKQFNTANILLQLFNPSVDFSSNLLANQTLFIPSPNGTNGTFPPYQSSSSNSSSSRTNRVLIGLVSVLGVVALVLFILVLCLSYALFSRRKQSKKGERHGAEAGLVSFSTPSRLLKLSDTLRSGRSGMLRFAGESHSQLSGPLRSGPSDSGPFRSGPLGSGPLRSGPLGSGPLRSGPLGSGPHAPNGRPGGLSPLAKFTLDKSVEFSFEELAAATDNFSVANKIGEGGYGAVYLATLRGQKTAVKRMNVQATREFLSELQILTHVHHTHLVQLIGYCTVDSLFLIYEFVEKGSLEDHLHGRKGFPPLPWSARVQIALDSARGLEYIHEHTKPTYIHRDVKTSNILLDKKFRAKVADFGLTKLTETGFSSMSISMSNPVRLVGTFGYMPPEYAKYGDVSPKVDVYSFGVVLFEIISAKSAIVKTVAYSGNPKIPKKENQQSLVGMFEEVLRHPHGKEALRGLVDPALQNNYPLESVWKMAQLATDCTRDNPELRPDMRTVVVALMTLSSTTNHWETGSFGSETVIPGLMSGR